ASDETGPWMTNFLAAQTEATKTGRRMLVLFTGSDWCPPCIRFEQDVAHNADFLAKTQTDLVLVKLDYPRKHPQPSDVKESLEKLRQAYGVAAYPTLLIVSADGTKALRVDTTHPRESKTPADYFVQAIDEARQKPF
ncbi:MAG TPA: thioredoxin family protein, partial [Opitutaceae bacterium]|nr:thioredoxin family protein [Opitutaceae bacterium]